MKIKTLFLLLFLANLSLAQDVETSLKRESITDNYSLNYSINSQKVLNGTYYINDLDKKLLLKGNYADGKKNGLWLLFNKDGSLEMSYNYSAGKLVFISPEFFSNIGYAFSDNKSNDYRLPLPLFSFDILFDLLSVNMAFKSLDEDSAKDLTLVASIDEKGKAIYLVNSKDVVLINNLEMENNKIFNLDWIPAFNNDKTAAIKLIFPISLKPTTDAEKQRFRWNY